MNALVLVLAAIVFATLRLGTPTSWPVTRFALTLMVAALVGLALWTVRQPITISVVYR